MIQSKDNPRGIFFVPAGERTKEKISLSNHLQVKKATGVHVIDYSTKRLYYFLWGGAFTTSEDHGLGNPCN